ncbi:MAG: 2-oxoacid:ferredoxin oxidoreductase subunit beta [Planctomycetes bacterium]|nr:2-oxoacid:ferredoxin oxidoreductase subunit beta [Planctomycetota bacterium]
MENATRFNTDAKPTWCPGCGNFGMQSAIKKALLSLDLQPHEVAMSSGIGCSGKIPHWINVYGFHGLHGRALPVATGLKLANHKLVVIAEGGDGDGYSEGMGHFIHACRRNVDMTYIVHNNGVYGLTTGQVSPTGDRGFASSTTPHGALEWPFEPLALAISAGANFVARGFSGDAEHLSGLIAEGIRHRGFSFIDVLQVCVSFNPAKSYKWYQERVCKVEDGGHDPTDRMKALERVFRHDDRLPIGVFYRGSEPEHEDGIPQLTAGPLVDRDITDVDIRALMEELI